MNHLVAHMALNAKTLSRLLALARANEEYAAKLHSEGRLDESNVYFGQSIGILACVEMLAAEYPQRGVTCGGSTGSRRD